MYGCAFFLAVALSVVMLFAGLKIDGRPRSLGGLGPRKDGNGLGGRRRNIDGRKLDFEFLIHSSWISNCRRVPAQKSRLAWRP